MTRTYKTGEYIGETLVTFLWLAGECICAYVCVCMTVNLFLKLEFNQT